jgi:hypothetical protein
MNDDFSVRARSKDMPFTLEFVAQAGKVVNLAVVSDLQSPLFIAHGHAAVRREIENCEAAAAETNVGTVRKVPLPKAIVIGPAMRLHPRHTRQRFAIPAINQATNAAHVR